MTLTVASLHIHPIKSLGGFPVEAARTTDRGFEHDRRWMLVDDNGTFITQREVPAMACLHCAPLKNGFRITDIRNGGTLDLPWSIGNGAPLPVHVWDDTCEAILAPDEWSEHLSALLGMRLRLVFMPDLSRREVDHRYASGINSFSDGFPYLIISQASLDDLNARMARALPMDRFRPNIVISGGQAFQEDTWRYVRIGGVAFSVVKPCGRCVITTTDQHTGERDQEPLRTLATYRRRKGTEGTVVDFGMNAMAEGGGTVHVGDEVHPITTM